MLYRVNQYNKRIVNVHRSSLKCSMTARLKVFLPIFQKSTQTHIHTQSAPENQSGDKERCEKV